MIPESLQEFVDRINIKLRYYRPNNTKTYRIMEVAPESNISIGNEYVLQSYEDLFWATGDSPDGWYPWGVILDHNTIQTLTGCKSEHDMELFLIGILRGIELML